MLTEMNRIIEKAILCNNLSLECAPSNPSLQFETQNFFFHFQGNNDSMDSRKCHRCYIAFFSV